MRYVTVVYHNEGRSTYFVIDTHEPIELQPAVVATYHEMSDANNEALRLNTESEGVKV